MAKRCVLSSHTSEIFFSHNFFLLPRHPIMHSISREEMRNNDDDKTSTNRMLSILKRSLKLYLTLKADIST